MQAIKIYPDPSDPNRSITRIGIYFTPEAIEIARSGEAKVLGADDIYSPNVAEGEKVVNSLEASLEVFTSTIEQEDHFVGEATQRAGRNGVLTHLQFGRNEPALHHYHNTFKEALNLPTLKRISGWEDTLYHLSSNQRPFAPHAVHVRGNRPKNNPTTILAGKCFDRFEDVSVHARVLFSYSALDFEHGTASGQSSNRRFLLKGQ